MTDFDFSAFYDRFPIALWRIRLSDGVVTHANQHCAQLLGYTTVDEVLGRAISTHLADEVRDAIVEECRGSSELHQREVMLVNSNNETIWVCAMIKVTEDGDFIEGSFVDITAKKCNPDSDVICTLQKIKKAAKKRLSDHRPRKR